MKSIGKSFWVRVKCIEMGRRGINLSVLILTCAGIVCLLLLAEPRGDASNVVKLLSTTSGRELHLLVNLWAPSLKVSPHRAEVIAAITSNLLNPHFNVIHVVLEATQDYHCGHVEEDVNGILKHSEEVAIKKLRCQERFSIQIAYVDMFSVAKTIATGPHKWISKKDIVLVLANADMVFDDSVRHLLSLKPDILAVIATSGLKPRLGPKYVKELYERFVSNGIAKPLINRCYDLEAQKRTSWDAFVFSPHRLKVVRESFLDLTTTTPYVMYQNGAEAAALNSILRHSAFKCVHQLCDHVRMWHFHTEEKTHFNLSEEFVEHEYSWPSECGSLSACMNTCQQQRS